MALRISQLDTERFGIRIAKHILTHGDSVTELLNSCDLMKVRLLIARTNTGECELIRDLEANGAAIADTLLYHRKPISGRATVALAPEFRIRLATPQDAFSVEALARRAFHEYTGHYHNDHRLNKQDADEVYASWARACCLKQSADEVFVVEYAEEIIAFAAVRRIDETTVDCPLCAVDIHWRGRNLLETLLIQCEDQAFLDGFSAIEYSTHSSNDRARSIIRRLGYELYSSVHTYHKWFDAS